MNSPILQLLVLAGIAVFLILRLKDVLGTREGFEDTTPERPAANSSHRPELAVIEGGPDRDITDYVEEGSNAEKALIEIKKAEASFGVGDFLQGARGAYEMILMGFERGNLAEIKPFLADDVYEAFAEVVETREKQGLSIEAEFIGIREVSLVEVEFDQKTRMAELTVKFLGELTSVVRDNAGDIIEGEKDVAKHQKDTWTFARTVGTDDPNWLLVATGG